MHDYYRIRPVGATSELDGRARDGEPASTVEAIRGSVTATRVIDDEASFDSQCFADDIVVDFPSMQAAVARIRASFLGA